MSLPVTYLASLACDIRAIGDLRLCIILLIKLRTKLASFYPTLVTFAFNSPSSVACALFLRQQS